jgi:hypothetical protein
MHWNMPGLTKFRFPHGKKGLVEVDIAASQMHGFRNA